MAESDQKNVISILRKSLWRGRFRGQKIMTLGFVVGTIGALIAASGYYFQYSNGVSFFYWLGVLLTIVGWPLMLFGDVVMSVGIVLSWWRFPPSSTKEKNKTGDGNVD